ncbi:hypothetical protein EVAR_65648_1 [Eumeta japonica]|uniref:Uncharacterized protein n=1 Tax=Eumeta variegata TaxID=151549 RepID=A0A4C1Z7A1_EUMVA|nr:hypothetical protein EVAR_65648_1 [Eumeta japonica]
MSACARIMEFSSHRFSLTRQKKRWRERALPGARARAGSAGPRLTSSGNSALPAVARLGLAEYGGGRGVTRLGRCRARLASRPAGSDTPTRWPYSKADDIERHRRTISDPAAAGDAARALRFDSNRGGRSGVGTHNIMIYLTRVIYPARGRPRPSRTATAVSAGLVPNFREDVSDRSVEVSGREMRRRRFWAVGTRGRLAAPPLTRAGRRGRRGRAGPTVPSAPFCLLKKDVYRLKSAEALEHVDVTAAEWPTPAARARDGLYTQKKFVY